MTRHFQKYFRYRSLDELRGAVAALHLDLAFDEDLGVLARPATLGDRAIGNRFAIHPMEGCDGTPDGAPGELTARRWHRFAAGGAKLLWAEATAVVPEGRANARQLVISESTLPALAELLRSTRRIHRERFGRDDDFLVGLQLTHSGRWSHGRPVIAAHLPFIDPRTFVDTGRTTPVNDAYPVITDTELDALRRVYLNAIGMAARAGFDFVDIKQCHTYLLGELLSARHREGKYGGSIENRMRFVGTLLDEARAAYPGMLLASRINVYDGVPFTADPATGTGIPSVPRDCMCEGFGMRPEYPWEPDLREPLELVRMMREKGVRLLNVSLGSPYYNPHLGRPYDRPNDGGYLPPEHPLVGVARHVTLTAAIQRAFPDMLTIGTGYSWLQQFCVHAGAAHIRRGDTAFMGLGRGALAYPDFAADALEKGRLDPGKVCLSVSFCTDLMRAKAYEFGQAPTGCVPRDKIYARIYKDVTSGKKP
jgi:NADPH2 dehydrogenase